MAIAIGRMGNMLMPAPFCLRNLIGPAENYFIHEGYEIREFNEWFDDRTFEAEFQKEVYRYARKVADKENLTSVCDIGCGSGFKLITNFFDFDTLGIDLAATVAFLNGKWPGRHWESACLEESARTGWELIIAVDVIEHLENPDALLGFIERSAPHRIILSTPERDELCLGTHDGPPKNIHHVREWNFAQFHAYIASSFEIAEHFVINGTQVIDCHPRD